MYAPSGVGSSARVVVRYSGVTTLMDVRYEMAISMPCASAWRKHPWAVVWLCADMEGEGGDVEDCTRIDLRHHGSSRLRSERRRGGG